MLISNSNPKNLNIQISFRVISSDFFTSDFQPPVPLLLGKFICIFSLKLGKICKNITILGKFNPILLGEATYILI
jgi:hypothetical protein